MGSIILINYIFFLVLVFEVVFAFVFGDVFVFIYIFDDNVLFISR